MNQKPEALIFDFDGVLADTERLYWRAWASLFASHNIQFSWEDYCKVGRGVQDEAMLDSMAQLTADPLLLAKIRMELPARRSTAERLWREKLPISEATIQLLHGLAGYRLGLVTTSKRADVEPMLESAQIADCFSATVFGEDTIHHKPHPAPYNLIRERLGIRGGVVFEDSEPGLQSATRAGFEALRIPDPEDLPGIVRSYLKLK
jgi:HAD superfamily hydrolase (TIGR01509 family)